RTGSTAQRRYDEVLGVSLVYSGNFVAGVEVDQFQTTRVFAGINPFDFNWLLEPGESFQTPEVVLVYSTQGWGGMSRTFHRLYRERLARGRYRDTERPILINNWEATYFKFNAEVLSELGALAGSLGIELFVLDDGWFGHRDDDHSSLGDWVVDTRKLPGGLDDLAKRLNASGLRFGLWFEPEMVSPDSDLYRNHPDWCLHVPGRSRTEGRNQLVLDYSRPDVCDAVIEMVSRILQSAPIRYVKWDMNRHMTEIGSAGRGADRQRETAHRYMLGLYRVLETITSSFPDVLFESCSGGGGRFDPGMLYYMPQVWTSDNTDAIERLFIQFGTSTVYPSIAMGAHVSAVPNHQVGRVTSMHTRGVVAMMGNLGYELDLRQLPQQDLETIAGQVAFYKKVRRLVQFGDLYRLLDPLDHGCAAWMFVDADREEALASFVRILDTANAPLTFVRLAGLDARRQYKVTLHGPVQPVGALRDGVSWQAGGDELMHHGLLVPRMWGDFRACTWRLRAL
ncbi:MAG: alpha-galactosidase, partial [Alicyclobacillus sp.]|nr:alpha-galactosidase [Alicyclobacillus sp.]